MVGLTNEQWTLVQKHFDTLVRLSATEQIKRIAKLKLAPDTMRELQSLLEASALTGLLDQDAPMLVEGQETEYSSLGHGAVVGGFVIEKLIGRGGMGEVYSAHRDKRDFEQHVALKLLRPEAAGQAGMFDRERRLLAGLEHPSIARLIDGGIASDGRPYMAMEFVDGVPVTQWCRERQANLATRLRLFEEICEAVSHAHSRLVIHRDLKPSNIMVDGNGHIRLLDFGIAKLADENGALSATTQAMVTPDYAAPEQLASEASTVGTDVYALGAVLFELLTGKGPWKRANESLPSIMRRILQEDPVLPSVAAAEPSVPASALKGDLDAIVMKAMRRAPTERYRSVDQLASDVRRHLALKPVGAREGNMRYLVGRFLRRNRLAVALSSAVGLAMLAGVGGIVWQAQKTAIERDRAIAEARRIEAANLAFMDMFQDTSDKSRFETTTMRQMIDGTKNRLFSSFRPESPDAAATIAALANLYLIASANDDARALLTEALAKGFGRTNSADLARLKLQLSIVEIRDKKTENARRLLNEARAVWRTDPDKYLRETIDSADVESTILWYEGKRDEAIALLVQNMAGAEKANSAYSRDLVWYYRKLVDFLVEQKLPKEARSVINRALGVLASRNERRSNAALLLRRFEAVIASENGDDQSAVQMMNATIKDRRELYGPSILLANDLLDLGRLYVKIDNPQSALPLLAEAAPISTQYYGSNSGTTFQITLARIDALADLSRLDEARKLLAEAEKYALGRGTKSLAYGNYLRTRANYYIWERKLDLADADLTAADRIFSTNARPSHRYKAATAKIRDRLNRARKGS